MAPARRFSIAQQFLLAEDQLIHEDRVYGNIHKPRAYIAAFDETTVERLEKVYVIKEEPGSAGDLLSSLSSSMAGLEVRAASEQKSI